MDHRIVPGSRKYVEISFKASKNLTPIEKHKIEEAIKQFMLKSGKQVNKLKARFRRILNEQQNEN